MTVTEETSVEVGTIYRVAATSELRDGERLIVSAGGVEFGVFRVGESLIAYENRCPHRGGPVCQGKILPNVLERLDGDRRSQGHAWDEQNPQISCPWHGYEFDLRTGRFPTDPRFRLRAAPVWEEGGEILLDTSRFVVRRADA